jgi:hypothetical protein
VDEVGKLILAINKTLLLGHFEHRPEDRVILYRSAMPLEKGCISEGQTLRLFEASVEQCMIFQKSFRQVVRGLSAGEALTSLMHMCETSGQA